MSDQKTAHALSREESQYRRALVVGRLVIGAFAVLVLGLLVAVVFLALQVRHTQLEGTPTGKKLLDSANTIKSCTATDGKCSKANRERTAELLSQLIDSQNRAAAAATACADLPGVQTYAETYACVIDHMQRPAPAKP